MDKQLLQKRLMTLGVLGIGVVLVIYLILYLIGIVFPNFEDTPTQTSSIELKNQDIQVIQDLDKINTYLLQPTVNPNEIGRSNPFAPI